MIIAILDQGSEPTTHAMQDISTFASQFEEKKLDLLFLFPTENEYQKFKLKSFNTLPKGILFGIMEEEIAKKVINNLKLDEGQRPIFILEKPNREVVFLRLGYTIGLGEQLLKTFSELE